MLHLPVVVWVFAASVITVLATSPQVHQEFPGVGSYHFNKDPLTWSDAYNHCKEMSGYLAIAESAPEANVLQEMMKSNHVDSIHVGFGDHHLEGTYFTILDTPVDAGCVNTWAPGAPIGGEEYNCGALTKEGLTDVNCSLTQHFICKLHLWESRGYERLEELGWYKHHPDKMTWGEAWEACRSEGAHLVILNSEEELVALHERYPFVWVWVGAHHVYANQQYVTIYGEPLETTGFTRWRSGDPAGNNEDHPYLAVQGTDGLYTSRGDTRREFICEHEFTA